ncbi:hypothetical protein MtrunA17_Chr8g0346411 [Medicago truncatula]|uniref:Transmembrane protein n=1 Tax=Medicago truncatula TaxID=3880 RepID=A0A396GLP3_MEDTR|nr:hypothetical protein MtrunA17_Chr8g0346411 [Medicago truncatula]
MNLNPYFCRSHVLSSSHRLPSRILSRSSLRNNWTMNLLLSIWIKSICFHHEFILMHLRLWISELVYSPPLYQ